MNNRTPPGLFPNIGCQPARLNRPGCIALLATLVLAFAGPGCAEVPSAPIAPVPNGPVTQWAVIGPLRAPAGGWPAVYEQDLLADRGGEAALVQPGSPDPSDSPTQVRPVSTGKHGILELNQSLGLREAIHSVAYAVARIQVDEAGPHFLALGVDDRATVWLDGEPVIDTGPRSGGLKANEFKAIRHLDVGDHLIVVKVGNDSGPWQLRLEVLDKKAQEAMNDRLNSFTRFSFPAQPEVGDWISRYLRRHYDTRLGDHLALFHFEYITLTDLWLNGAVTRSGLLSAQEAKREDLLNYTLRPSGYINTQQHISHAHEYGWPFPMWPQIPLPTGHNGYTWGWHFQAEPQIWGVWQHKMIAVDSELAGPTAAAMWELNDVVSHGINTNHWHTWEVEVVGPAPSLTGPTNTRINAFTSPWLQVRWAPAESATATPLVLQWMREGDTSFSEDRSVPVPVERSPHSEVTGLFHSMIPLYEHPQWTGTITRLRLQLAPATPQSRFQIDSIFTCFDTRHPVNNPFFILSSWHQVRWTRDVDFLQQNIQRMRTAMTFSQTELGGLQHKRIRVPWVGHDGLSGFVVNQDGSKSYRPGHGIGNNYWDLMPFGWDDMYATSLYYASLLAQANVEEQVTAHPEWGIQPATGPLSAAALRAHAAEVKQTANKLFWNDETGRFVASIDKNGKAYDYGYTFVNLEAIYYGIASEEHAQQILEWISGERTVEGDTSTGEDIYRWRFGPRASTLRNIDWYNFVWTGPETIPWGGQVQDGGAVLGFSFYDLWARLHTLGADNAWDRFREIYAWEQDVEAAGGYRAFYADGSQGTTLQGGGTAGGIGIDAEFYESILLPSIVTYGFMGIQPQGDALRIDPKVPSQCPEMTVRDLLYAGNRLDVTVTEESIEVVVSEDPTEAIHLRFIGSWQRDGSDQSQATVRLERAGTYQFVRQ